MHLLILFLGFMLFPQGYAMNCQVCKGSAACNKTQACPGMCAAATVKYEDGKTKSMKYCAEAKMCTDGAHLSMNIGSRRALVTCCNKALCNKENPKIPSNIPSTEKKCYTCAGADCSEMKELQCSEGEDRCISGYEVMVGKEERMKVMGCTQSSMCNMPNISIGVMELAEVTCCEGDLCNGSSSVAVSLFLILLAPAVVSALFN